jgi:hypothetical protein
METTQKETVLSILAMYNGLNETKLNKLIEATNGITGVSFVSINGYSSDKSNHTEVANQVVNIGAAYANMLKKDENIYANFDVNSVDVEKFNYESIDMGKLSIDEFKKQVKENLAIALEELNQPKAKKETNDIWLNKVLCFNTTTMRLSILGQSIKKTVETKGEFKKVKSAPKTIAKRLIEKQAKGRTASLRRFALDNLINDISISGDKLEIV